MTRTFLTAVGLVILGTGALAQRSATVLPVPGVKHAGTYHHATGTWTRGDSSLKRATYDVVYDNTCQGAWYAGFEQQTFHDDGRLPSTTSPQIDQDAFGSGTWANTSLTGTSDSYGITWYQIGYCTSVAAPMTAIQYFYECYTACSDATLLTPTAAIQLSGLPGSPTPGAALGCWTVDVDLLGSSMTFGLQGDCDGMWDGTPALDFFGYMYMQVTPSTGLASGPLLAGDPDGLLQDGPAGTGCCVGCGTIFWAGANVSGTSTQGSGLNTQDHFEVDDHLGGYTFSYNGCFWYGGYSANTPHADIHLELAVSYGPTHPGDPYCFGYTAAGNPCPCGNDNGGHQRGCGNGTFPGGAELGAFGVPSVSNDSLALWAMFGQPDNSSMFFQGANNLDGQGVFLGDGIRCAGGNVKRLKVQVNDSTGYADTVGLSLSARSAQLGYTIQPGDVLRYQWWYRDTNNPPCGLGTNDSNTSNGYEIHWLP